jgi:hypothetical protein
VKVGVNRSSDRGRDCDAHVTTMVELEPVPLPNRADQLPDARNAMPWTPGKSHV